MTEASRAVFLSYASQDEAAAQRICEALRAAGIEVWFDRSELRGGDAWDAMIRRQIKSCALFMPVISRNTHARDEGYFRLEWKLAVDRSHLMTVDRAFVVPVVVDDTRDDDERVPDKFRELQWTRLPGGDTPPQFVTRIQRLLAPETPQPSAVPAAPPAAAATTVGSAVPAPGPVPRHSPPALVWVLAGVVFAALTYFIIDKLWLARRTPVSQPAPSASVSTAAPSAPAAFAPPPHSIAVLPFVNMSGDKEQEYFSEGLTEEILNSLARINELQVAARTSSFSFQGEHPDIATVAHKLNVGAVLEGSVRRSAHTVRVTAQLINAVTGFHLWSETYDRDLGDVLKLQTEIANAVAAALKVTLLGDVAAKIELGGTHNPAAFDAYLRGWKAHSASHDEKDLQTAIAAYTEAIRLDPNYALAFANRSLALNGYAGEFATGPARGEMFAKAEADARKAIALTPDLAEGHLALESFFENGSLDFARANEEYERALALAPGNTRVLRNYGRFVVDMGRPEAGVAAARRAVALDPLNRNSHSHLGLSLYLARQYDAAIAALQDALALDPGYPTGYANRGLAYYAHGDLQNARASCEIKPDIWASQVCLAVTYAKLGRHADAESMLARMQVSFGDDEAYQYVEIYAQWGNSAKALDWLEKAVRLRDPGLVDMKVDPLLDPLRKEPRFQVVERALRFPSS